MRESIAALTSAVQTLVEIAGDQTASVGQDHKDFMAGDATSEAKKFLGLRQVIADVVKYAPHGKLQALTQVPGGTYSAQSGEIVGILKQMLDTFKDNLQSAIDTEASQLAAFTEFKSVKSQLVFTLGEEIRDKGSQIGENADTISANLKIKSTQTGNKAADEEELSTTTASCDEQLSIFEERRTIRANEQSSISQAIAVLNSDAAFDNFGSSNGMMSFLQKQRKHSMRHKLLKLLARSRSLRVAQVSASLKQGTPFDTILKQIRNMLVRIEEEGAADADAKAWHDEEKKVSILSKEDREKEIETLTGEIIKVQGNIRSMEATIKDTNTDIHEYQTQMDTATQNRIATHTEYLEEAKTLQQSHATIAKAVKVLRKFYDWLARREKTTGEYTDEGKKDCHGHYKRLDDGDQGALEQACEDDVNCDGFYMFPGANNGGWLLEKLDKKTCFQGDGNLFTKQFRGPVLLQQAPKALESSYRGQNGEKPGDNVIALLETIQGDQQKELMKETEQEEDMQATFEKVITEMNADIQRARELVDETALTKAKAAKNVLNKEQDLRDTQAALDKVIAYINSINPMYTYWTNNIETRKANQAAETQALENAIKLLEGSPVFKKHALADRKSDLGECAEKCYLESGDSEEPQVEGWAPCEACKRNVTVAGYCSGEGQGAPGCDAKP